MSSEHARYDCHGIHKSLPKGRASGVLTVTPAHLQFVIQDHKIRLGFEQLEVKLGGASDRLVFMSSPSRPDWRFYTSDRSILKDPTLKSHAHLSKDMTAARGKRQMNWAILFAVLFVLIATPIFLLSNMDYASKIVAEQIPVEWEEKLGETSFEQYTLQVEFMDEKESKALLQPLVTPLLDALPNKRFKYKFYISADDQLNAFALPGGIVVLNAGLILAADNAEEVLGVVAHEITHVRQRHGIRNVISSVGTYLLISAIVGDVSGIFAVLVDAAPLLINQGYSRKFESEADALGFDMLVAANIDPSGLASFFEKLIEKEDAALKQVEDEQQRKWLKEGMSYLSSHPQTEDRIAALNQREAETSREYQDFSQPFAELKEHVAAFVVEQKETEADSEEEAAAEDLHIDHNSEQQ